MSNEDAIGALMKVLEPAVRLVKEKPIRRLECCCCGDSTRGRQWWNRDTGYGICRKCVAWIKRSGKESQEEMVDLYGHEGVHYNVDGIA